ncbi:hypothetical protein EON65_00220 [archaeon]|nr:MAG: hypothetical protein EON65_00220 [archaeon]
MDDSIEHTAVSDHDIVNPLVMTSSAGGGGGDRRRTLSLLRAPSAHGDSVKADEDEADDVFMNIMTPGYLMSYEGIAKSLSEMNPLLSMHAEKLNIFVKVMYADKPNESRNTTLRALLFDVLNNSMKLDKLFGKKKGKRSSEGSIQPPIIPVLQPPQDQRKLIPELKQRDLRRLESHYNSKEEPYILIRRHAILLSMGPLIRAVIQADKLFLIVHEEAGNAEVLNQLERHIDGWLKVPPSHTDFPSVDLPNPHSSVASKLSTQAAESLAQVLPFDCRAYEVDIISQFTM